MNRDDPITHFTRWPQDEDVIIIKLPPDFATASSDRNPDEEEVEKKSSPSLDDQEHENFQAWETKQKKKNLLLFFRKEVKK